MRIELRMPPLGESEIEESVARTLLKSSLLNAMLSIPLSGNSCMSKLAEMAARARRLPQKLDDLADKMIEKMETIESRGDEALAGIDRVVTEAEQGVRTVEDTLNQMTNSPPQPESQR